MHWKLHWRWFVRAGARALPRARCFASPRCAWARAFIVLGHFIPALATAVFNTPEFSSSSVVSRARSSLFHRRDLVDVEACARRRRYRGARPRLESWAELSSRHSCPRETAENNDHTGEKNESGGKRLVHLPRRGATCYAGRPSERHRDASLSAVAVRLGSLSARCILEGLSNAVDTPGALDRCETAGGSERYLHFFYHIDLPVTQRQFTHPRYTLLQRTVRMETLNDSHLRNARMFVNFYCKVFFTKNKQ